MFDIHIDTQEGPFPSCTIKSFMMSQREGEYPCVFITLSHCQMNVNNLSSHPTKGRLFLKKQKIFEGEFVGFTSADIYEKTLAFRSGLSFSQIPCYQEDATELLYIEPSTGVVGKSDLFKGRSTTDITPYVDVSHLKMQVFRPPINEVTLTLTAHFNELLEGIFDIQTFLKNHCICDDAIAQTFSHFHDPCYQVVRQENHGIKLYWHQTIKHKQALSFCIKSPEKIGRTKTLTFAISHEASLSHGNFFHTEEAQEFIKHTCRVAWAHMRASYRNARVWVCIPIEYLDEINLDTTCMLELDPVGKIEAKVIELNAYYSFEKSYLRLALGFCYHNQHVIEPPLETSCEASWQRVIKPPLVQKSLEHPNDLIQKIEKDDDNIKVYLKNLKNQKKDHSWNLDVI